MFIPFSQLAPQSRIWIYQSDRKFSESDLPIIKEKLYSFTDQWLVHGAPLEASFDVKFNQFIVIGANDTTSGCSIDASVRVVKELGDALKVDLFNRNLIAFNSAPSIRLINMSDLKAELAQGTWGADTPVFNNVITTLSEIEKSWLVPAGSTWLKRYLPKTQSVE